MILVTGGTGLVGAHLLVQLTRTETRIKAICRPESDVKKVEKIFSYYSDEYREYYKKITWVIADINDIPALEIAFEGITHVYHCAALISFDPKDYNKMNHVNCNGTATIVNLCIHKNIKKLCYVSSIATIGKNVNTTKVDEESDWSYKDVNVYAHTKYNAEMEVWRGSQEGLSTVIINPGVVLGPGFWGSGSGAFFTTAKKNYNYYPPNGTGFIAVNDVVQLMLLAMNSDVNKERFIVVSENLSYKTILTKISIGLEIKPPSKELKFWQLKLLWKLDWFRNIVLNKRRKITKKTVKSLREDKIYDNQKVIKTFNFTFEPIEKTIAFCCEKFLEEDN
tara:strand:- start:1986 stop:2993 length:1008 start_codon:yes stop_codon:yes gene_type:complete